MNSNPYSSRSLKAPVRGAQASVRPPVLQGAPESSPFAREVYRLEDAPGPKAELLEEIAALRAEVRTEVRALRGAIGRPKPNR